MMLADAARDALALAVGFLLGSVLPADLLARRQRVDIRSSGDGNPGTINAFKVLGWRYGLATAAYDVSVGVWVVLIAEALGVSAGVAEMAGLMSVLGHRFPVFSGFRGGGQGMGASAGLLLYGVGVSLAHGWLTLLDVGILVLIVAALFALTRSGKAGALVMLPLLAVRLAFSRPDWQFLAFMLAVTGHIWIVQLSAVLGWPQTRPDQPAGSPNREQRE